MFSELEKKALEPFVTSAEDSIYAIRHNIPPEVFGAFGSFFSRNPKDFREHLLDAILGRIKGFEEDVDAQKILQSLANKELREPSEAIKSGLAKSQEFFRQFYGAYSHKSIANTVWIPMVGTNVSQLFARELAYEQLAFFIEQSTRYVLWDISKMRLDQDIMNSRHRERFVKTLEHLTESYRRLSDFATEYYKEMNPFKEWLAKQSESVQKGTEKSQTSTYERQIRGAALDVSRFLLPQACQTNIAWIVDARSTEFDIAAWKGHPLREIRESAELIEKHAGQIAPSLLKYTERNDYYGDKLNGHDGDLKSFPAMPFEKGVDIISYDPDALNKTIAHLLKRHNLGGTFRQRYEEVQGMSFSEKIGILERVTRNRREHDEWLEMDEEFDLVKITCEIRTDIGAKRDLVRHQKWDRSESLYSTENGFYMPPMITNMVPEAKEVFENAVNRVDETHSQIRRDLSYQAQYVVPMATRHAITMSAGLDQLQYMLETRSTNQGNFSYRQDAFNLAEAALRVHPWLLGYEKYPEGKDFMQVYKEAPLKGVLRLDTRETRLHQ